MGGSFGTRLGSRFGARGVTRGAAMAVSGLNVLGCGLTYAFGRREDEERVV